MVRRINNGHPADHELLLAAGAGERPARRLPVDRHLDDCAACRTRLEVLHATLQEASEEYQRVSTPDDASMARQRARLAQTLLSIPAPRRPWWSPLSIADLPSWAVAAVAVAAIVLTAPWALWMSLRADDDRSSVARELPAAELTPGASAAVSVGDLCDGRGPSRVVSTEVRRTVLRAYGMEDVPAEAYELDALITPELGGTTDARNLWPQRYTSLVWHARIKDVLEERLAADVCAGRVDLGTAQRELSIDWVAAYRRYFQTDVPLQAHLAYGPDEPELEMAAPRPPRIGAYAEAMALMTLSVSRPHATESDRFFTRF
jgi:hypothetical protein